MKHDTAGDPMTGLKWTRKTTEKVARQLAKLGIAVDAKTVGRILKKLGYSLRVNSKKISSSRSPDRNAQFEYIAELREQFASRGEPVASVDTKKKELVGNFKNNGVAWSRAPINLNDHDFRSLGMGIAVPYGIYDVEANLGFVFIGTSYDTPQLSVDAIERWRRYDFTAGGSLNGLTARKGPVDMVLIEDE